MNLRAQLTHILTLISLWALLLARLEHVASLEQIVVRPAFSSTIYFINFGELHIARVLAAFILNILHLIISLSQIIVIYDAIFSFGELLCKLHVHETTIGEYLVTLHGESSDLHWLVARILRLSDR